MRLPNQPATSAKASGAKHGANHTAVENARVVHVHDTGRGAVITKYQQTANGYDVFGRSLAVVMNQDLELTATSGYFSPARVPTLDLTKQFKLNDSQAINKALSEIEGDSVNLTKHMDKAGWAVYKASHSHKYHFTDDPRIKRIYYPTPDKTDPGLLCGFDRIRTRFKVF